jgi:DNA mismatch repair protein MutS2
VRFAIGAEVVVRTLARKRGIVIEAASGGRYRLRVEGLTVWCRDHDLESAPEPRTKKRADEQKTRASLTVAARQATRTGRLDLHGATVDEALERLVAAIDRAILAGADRIEVVHGKGAGRIKRAVHRQLASMPGVAAFKLDEQNAGVTWVYL